MTQFQTQPTRAERIDAFCKWLEDVLRAAHSSEPFATARLGGNPRAILADLRRGLNGRVESQGQLWPHVGRFMGEKEEPSDRWFFVVAALAAWHPQPGAPRGQSLGAAASVLRESSASMTAHFAALLACDERDLPHHLRHITALLAAKDAPVNWHQLLHDLALTSWRHPERKVQSRWARDFYRTEFSSTSAPEDDDAVE